MFQQSLVVAVANAEGGHGPAGLWVGEEGRYPVALKGQWRDLAYLLITQAEEDTRTRRDGLPLLPAQAGQGVIGLE